MGHIEVTYFLCDACGSVHLPDPTWLEEAYGEAIASLDVGLLSRAFDLANIASVVLRSARLPRTGRYLDWAGGYGALTRLMRDRGYAFIHTDPWAPNLFARGFSVEGPVQGHFDLITAFEVLEHLVRPAEELADVASRTDRLLVTTHLLPEPLPAPDDWWYYAPRTGQHVTFYTAEGLTQLAQRLGFDGVVSGDFVHLLYRGRLPVRLRMAVRHPRWTFLWGHLAALTDRRYSLAAADFAAQADRDASP
jgi:hypothetical protein